MSRRTFTKDFKIAAVKLVVEDEMDVKTVAQHLDVHYNSLYRWGVRIRGIWRQRLSWQRQ